MNLISAVSWKMTALCVEQFVLDYDHIWTYISWVFSNDAS